MGKNNWFIKTCEINDSSETSKKRGRPKKEQDSDTGSELQNEKPDLDETGFGNLFDGVEEDPDDEDLEEESPLTSTQEEPDEDDENAEVYKPEVDPKVVDKFVEKLTAIRGHVRDLFSNVREDLEMDSLESPVSNQLYEFVNSAYTNMQKDKRLDEHWHQLNTNAYLALVRLKSIFFEFDMRLQTLTKLLADAESKEIMPNASHYMDNVSHIRGKLNKLLPIYNMYWKKYRKS